MLCCGGRSQRLVLRAAAAQIDRVDREPLVEELLGGPAVTPAVRVGCGFQTGPPCPGAGRLLSAVNFFAMSYPPKRMAGTHSERATPRGGRPVLRLALGMAQMFFAIVTVVLLLETGVSVWSLTATAVTCALTTISVLLFGRGKHTSTTDGWFNGLGYVAGVSVSYVWRVVRRPEVNGNCLWLRNRARIKRSSDLSCIVVPPDGWVAERSVFRESSGHMACFVGPAFGCEPMVRSTRVCTSTICTGARFVAQRRGTFTA
jgi:hypothetical protein